jgi:hypothetical protein
VSVAGRPAFQDHRLGLEEREQALGAAFAADPGLLEPAERDAEVRAEGVVADSAGVVVTLLLAAYAGPDGQPRAALSPRPSAPPAGR